MMLTRYIRDAIAEGHASNAFVMALINWGRWSRYFGCMGYGGKHSSDPDSGYVIDDESALLIDKAFCDLKERRPSLYLVLKFFYIGGLSEKQIVYKLQRLHLVEDRSLKYANMFTIREIINNGEQAIYNTLTMWQDEPGDRLCA